MKILVLGCNGQLGRCLNDQLEKTDHKVIYTSRDHINIADFSVAKSQIRGISPDVVINATAYTAVDMAEEEQEKADLINNKAVANVASICGELDCWLIHVSTDYVFDGLSAVPYLENDKVNPQGVYGATKLKGELAIQASGCKYLIIRTAWVFSEYGSNFLKTMLRLGAERDEISIVGDQIGCPTYGQDLANGIINIIPFLQEKETVSGVYHYGGDHPCSWYEFALAIFLEAKKMGLKTPQLVHSIGSSAYPTRAVRPFYSVLDCRKINDFFGVNTSDWGFGVKDVIGKLQTGKP